MGHAHACVHVCTVRSTRSALLQAKGGCMVYHLGMPAACASKTGSRSCGAHCIRPSAVAHPGNTFLLAHHNRMPICKLRVRP